MMYIAMHVTKVGIEWGNRDIEIGLPNGCDGVCLVFKTKKAAREWFGKKVELAEIREKGAK